MTVLHYSDRASPEFPDLYRQADVLVVTGDLTLWDFPGLQEFPEKKPEFGVYGNHDSGQYFEPLGITNLHWKTAELGGFTWGGFQGCLKYKDTGIMYTEEEARDFSDRFPRVDVLLLHAGPAGMLDDPSDVVHCGSESLHRYVLEKRPRVVFCGHQYSDASLVVGATTIHRTYGARLIEI